MQLYEQELFDLDDDVNDYLPFNLRNPNFPDIPREDLTGAAVFRDAQMYNPTRLVLAFLRSASEKGAQIANYVRAEQLLVQNGTVQGVRVCDELTGETFDIKSRMVLNAAGPWAEQLLEHSRANQTIKPGTYSRDACFVVKRRLPGPYALAVQGRTHDPDALLSRPARHLFLVPWRDYTLVGVWHVVYKKGPDQITMGAEELESFLGEINWAYPSLKLSLDDITMWNAGLVPFGENEAGSENLSYGKRSRLIDHHQEGGPDGLVTLIGIRYTMGRGDAAHALDLVCQKLGYRTKRPATEWLPIYGGDFKRFDDLVREISEVGGLNAQLAEALAHNHGAAYREVLRLADTRPELLEPLANTTVLKAEIVHAIHQEMAITLSDLVFRRTDLATGGNPGDQALLDCAALAARELGWSDSRTTQEIDRIKARFSQFSLGALEQTLQ